MNALKFQNIREKRQECFNVDEYTFNDFDFDGKRRKVYSNVNLSIFTDDYCNANCKFCVAQLRFENKGKMYKKSRIASDDEYFSVEDHNSAIVLPKGTIRRLTGRDLKWEDDPISLKSVIEGLLHVDIEFYKQKIINFVKWI